jgi:putative oxidoreductase
MWSVLKNYTDGALLFLRITLGSFFLYVHGWPMLAGGLSKWRAIGGAMRHIGVTYGPGFWGFLAAASESLGCLLFVIGFAFRPSCLMLFLTLTVAAIADYHGGGFSRADHAIEMTLVFFALMFVGPGKFSFDKG